MLPHNVVADAQGRVYVTDCGNQRIEVFDANGKYLTEWKEPVACRAWSSRATATSLPARSCAI